MGVVNANSNNYNNLINKPSINGVPLEGNKTSEDLGIDNEIFVVHAYGDGTDGSTPVVDKEFDEIWDAIHSGKNVVAYYHNTNIDDILSFPTSAWYATDDGHNFISFRYLVIGKEYQLQLIKKPDGSITSSFSIPFVGATLSNYGFVKLGIGTYPVPVTNASSNGGLAVRALPSPSGSSIKVGDFLKVKAITDDKYPEVCEVEAVTVDFPEPVQSNWMQTDDTQLDYIKNQPDYIDDTVVPNIFGEFATPKDFTATIYNLPKKIYIRSGRNFSYSIYSNQDVVGLVSVYPDGTERSNTPSNKTAVSTGRNALYKYAFIIKSSYFDGIGNYTLSVYGVDAAGNRSVPYIVEVELTESKPIITTEPRPETLVRQSDFVYAVHKLKDELDEKINVPAIATIGQTITVKSIDESGKPIEWETVDLPKALPVPVDGDAGKVPMIQDDLSYALEKVSGSGIDLTGAAVDQIAKITAVDENGKPTAWEAIDLPNGLPVATAEDIGKVPMVQDDNTYGLNKVIPSPDTAQVGQTIVVKAVDENGKPTAWEAADISCELIASVTLKESAATVEFTGLNLGVGSYTIIIRNTGKLTGAGLSISLNGITKSGYTGSFYDGNGITSANISVLGSYTLCMGCMSNGGKNEYMWDSVTLPITSISVFSPYHLTDETKYFSDGTVVEIYRGVINYNM